MLFRIITVHLDALIPPKLPPERRMARVVGFGYTNSR